MMQSQSGSLGIAVNASVFAAQTAYPQGTWRECVGFTSQSANRDERAGVVERGPPLARRELDNLSPRLGKERRAQDNHRIGIAAGHFGEGACDLLSHRCRHRERFNAIGPRRAYDLIRAVWMRRIVRIEQTAIRFACGTSLLSNSTCLPAISGCRIESPMTSRERAPAGRRLTYVREH
jgi:hypothetical protein